MERRLYEKNKMAEFDDRRVTASSTKVCERSFRFAWTGSSLLAITFNRTNNNTYNYISQALESVKSNAYIPFPWDKTATCTIISCFTSNKIRQRMLHSVKKLLLYDITRFLLSSFVNTFLLLEWALHHYYFCVVQGLQLETHFDPFLCLASLQSVIGLISIK